MPTVGTTSKPAYVYDAGSDTWIPIGPGEHSHSYIPNTLVDAKGDILTATAADTPAILAAGTNGQYLSANSSTATGLEWVAAPTAGSNWSLLNSGGTSLSGSGTVSITGISGKDKILVLISGASTNTDYSYFGIRLNADSGNNYNNYGLKIQPNPNTPDLQSSQVNQTSTDIIQLGRMDLSSTTCSGYVLITGCNSNGVKAYTGVGGTNPYTGSWEGRSHVIGGFYNSASNISSVQITFSQATSGWIWDAGTVYIYTSA